MVNSISYYKNSESKFIKFGEFKSYKNFPLLFSPTKLSVQEFNGLAHVNRCIDGQIIDAYTITHIDTWQKVTYLPTDIGYTILGTYWNKRRNSTARVLNIKDELCDTTLMPYMFDAHWRLLVIDKVNENLITMDPYRDDSNSERVMKSFLKYINECSKNSFDSSLFYHLLTFYMFKTYVYIYTSLNTYECTYIY